MRDIVPRTIRLVYYYGREIILDGDRTSQETHFWLRRLFVQFRHVFVQLALVVQFQQRFAHHAIDVRVSPLQLLDCSLHLCMIHNIVFTRRPTGC